MRRVLLAVLFVAVVAAPAHAAETTTIIITTTTTWQRPVLGQVVRPFTAPATPYGRGHRGVDFATRPGTLVRATGRGTVSFAGRVAGDLHVTVRHAGGLRTTYSYLATVEVAAGERVRRGQVVGATRGTHLHFGLRAGDRYVDPLTLFGPPAVHLVPLNAAKRTEVGIGPPATLTRLRERFPA